MIFTGEDNQIHDLKNLKPLGKSDHSVIVFNFQCYLETKQPSKRYIYTQAEFALMRDLLETSGGKNNFTEEATGKSVETLWYEFKGTISRLRDRYVPLKEIGKSYWKDKGKIPINLETQRFIREKRRLHRKWIKSSPATRQENRKNYINMRNEVNRRLTQAKRNF